MHVNQLCNREQHGFALIDAMLAIFVIAWGVVAAMDLIMTAQTDIDYQRKMTLAGILASGKLEELDAKDDFTGLPIASTNFGTEYGLTTYNSFTYTVSIADVTFPGAAPSASLAGISKVLTVDVLFKDLRGKQHTVTVKSIKTARV